MKQACLHLNNKALYDKIGLCFGCDLFAFSASTSMWNLHFMCYNRRQCTTYKGLSDAGTDIRTLGVFKLL